MRDDRVYENWVAVFKTTTDYEADLVRDRLDDAGIPAVVLTQRDHAFNLTVGDLAPVNVMVPPDRLEDAQALLAEAPFTDDELTDAALAADPSDSPAHGRDMEARLDSGIEEIRFDVPDEEDDRP